MDPALTCGTIMLDMKCKNSTLIQKANEGYPIVALDRIMDVPNIKSVVVNNYADVYKRQVIVYILEWKCSRKKPAETAEYN